MKETNIDWKPQPVLEWYEGLLSGGALILLIVSVVIIVVSIYFTQIVTKRSKSEKKKVYKKHKQELLSYFVFGFVSLSLSIPAVIYYVHVMETRTENNYVALSEAIEKEYNVDISTNEAKQLLNKGHLDTSKETLIAQKTFDSIEIEVKEKD